MTNKQLGDKGENIAIEYLVKKGFKIIDSNVFTRFGEIDIVAYGNKSYHFVEVKCRKSYKYGSALESISSNKISHLLKSIDIYLSKNSLHNAAISVDLIAIDFSKESDKPKIEWIENVTM